MKKRESERFFRDANRRLEANEQAMSFFKKYGIHPETLRMLLIGMDEDENIVSPIYNNNNVILGKLTIQNIYEDPIYSHDSYGFVGNPRSKDKTITIAKNIIDVCLLWQLGIDNPVMIPDRDQVHYLHKYKELIFVDGDDSVVDLYPGIKNEYKIKDIIICVLRDKSEVELIAPDSQEYLKTSIREALATKINIENLIDIYIDEFVIQ